MAARMIGVSAAFLIAGCETPAQPGGAQASIDPYVHCKQRGARRGAEFERCVDNFINDKCAREGHQPDTAAHANCSRDLWRLAFVQHQLDVVRGR